MGFFNDLFSHPLNSLKQVADFAAPVVSFLPGGAQAEGAFNMFNNMFGDKKGGAGGGYGNSFGNIAGGQNGYFNPAVSQILGTPWGQNLQYGSPYKADNGMGAKQQDIANDQHWRGQDFLNQSQTLPGLDQMGVLGNEKNVMNQQAKYAGVASPFGDFSGSQDPYSLTPYQQTAYNGQADLVNGSRDQALSQLQSQLAASGINDPRAAAIAQANIHSQHNAHLQQSLGQMQQQSYGDRMNTLNGFNGQLQNLYGAQNNRQMGLNQLGNQFQGNAANNYSDLARRNIGMSNERDSSLASLYGLGMGSQPFNFNGQGGYGQNTGLANNNPNVPQWYGSLGGTPGQSGQYSGPSYETGDLGGNAYNYPNSSYGDYNMPMGGGNLSQYNWNY